MDEGEEIVPDEPVLRRGEVNYRKGTVGFLELSCEALTEPVNLGVYAAGHVGFNCLLFHFGWRLIGSYQRRSSTVSWTRRLQCRKG